MSGRSPYHYNSQSPYLQGNPNAPPTTTAGQQYSGSYAHNTYASTSGTHLSPDYTPQSGYGQHPNAGYQHSIAGEIKSESELAKERRRNQNKEAQRKFRQQKERKINELKEKLDDLQKNLKDLRQEKAQLKATSDELQSVITELREENRLLKEAMGSSPSSSVSSWYAQDETYGYQSESSASAAHERPRRR